MARDRPMQRQRRRCRRPFGAEAGDDGGDAIGRPVADRWLKPPCAGARGVHPPWRSAYQSGGCGLLLRAAARWARRGIASSGPRSSPHPGSARCSSKVEGLRRSIAGALRRIDAVVAELIGRDAAADAELEPPVAEMVEQADLLGDLQGMAQRQDVDERAEAGCRLVRWATALEPGAGGRRRRERRRMVLADMVACRSRRWS